MGWVTHRGEHGCDAAATLGALRIAIQRTTTTQGSGGGGRINDLVLVRSSGAWAEAARGGRDGAKTMHASAAAGLISAVARHYSATPAHPGGGDTQRGGTLLALTYVPGAADVSFGGVSIEVSAGACLFQPAGGEVPFCRACM